MHCFPEHPQVRSLGSGWTLPSRPAEAVLKPSPLPSLRYCAGTMPWGHPGEHHDFEPQRHDDGYLEVIGFTMTSLVSEPGCTPTVLGVLCPQFLGARPEAGGGSPRLPLVGQS